MPPRKRTRQQAQDTIENGLKKLKNELDEKKLPVQPIQRADVYKPQQTVHDNIKRNVAKIPKDRELEQASVVLRVSPTEGDLLLGKDGETNLNKLISLSKAGISVGKKVARSIDREVYITGNTKSVVTCLLATAYFLSKVVDEKSGTDSVYQLTLLLSHRVVESVGLDNLLKLLPNVDISSQFVPFSNRHTSHFEGKLPGLVDELTLFLWETQNPQLKLKETIVDIEPLFKVPVTGSHTPILSQEAKDLISKSKIALEKYLKQETRESTTQRDKNQDLHQENHQNPRQIARKQVESAIQECHKQSKALEQLKFAVDFPIDLVSHLNLTEIRSKSNSNVVLDNSNSSNSTQNQFKKVKITGLPEANLIALRFLLKVL